MVQFFINNLETIKNTMLSLASLVVFIGSIIFYIKIYINAKKIKKINKEIEKKQTELDSMALDDIDCGVYKPLDLSNKGERSRKALEQSIQKFKRRKEYLLEDISIFKIFKK